MRPAAAGVGHVQCQQRRALTRAGVLQGLQGGRLDQRHIAIEHQHHTIVAQHGHGLHCVASATLRLLAHKLHVAARKRRLTCAARQPVTTTHWRGAKRLRGMQHMGQQGLTCQCVQHFGAHAFHACALPCRHDDHICLYFVCVRCHNCCPCESGVVVFKDYPCLADAVVCCFAGRIAVLSAGYKQRCDPELLVATATWILTTRRPPWCAAICRPRINGTGSRAAPLRQLLQRMQALALQDITAEQTCRGATNARTRVSLADQSAQGLSLLVPMVKPEQIEHLTHQLDKRNRQWREQWLEGSLQERQQRRLKAAIERAQRVPMVVCSHAKSKYCGVHRPFEL